MPWFSLIGSTEETAEPHMIGLCLQIDRLGEMDGEYYNSKPLRDSSGLKAISC